MSDYKSKVFKSHHKQLIKEARSKIKDQMNAFKTNYKKFNDLKLFIQSNEQVTEEEILSKINDIKNSKDYIEPYDVDSKEFKIADRFVKSIIKQHI